MHLNAIIAIARDGAIGHEGKLPWTLREDMKHFRSVTMGHAVIMGRATYQSIGKPLPGRRNIVMTTTIGGLGLPGCFIAHNYEAALKLAGEEDETPFVIGGASVYQCLWPFIQTLWLTEVHRDVPGADTRFDFGREQWEEVWREDHRPAGYSFTRLERR